MECYDRELLLVAGRFLFPNTILHSTIYMRSSSEASGTIKTLRWIRLFLKYFPQTNSERILKPQLIYAGLWSPSSYCVATLSRTGHVPEVQGESVISCLKEGILGINTWPLQ